MSPLSITTARINHTAITSHIINKPHICESSIAKIANLNESTTVTSLKYIILEEIFAKSRKSSVFDTKGTIYIISVVGS